MEQVITTQDTLPKDRTFHGRFTVTSDESYDRIIWFLNDKKNTIKDLIETYLLTYKEQQHHYIESRYKNQTAIERRLHLLDQELEEKEDRVKRIFDEFSFVEPTTIHYGTVSRGNFWICRYGNTDAFKNAIWIHTNLLLELLEDLPKYLPVQRAGREYINFCNSYYKLLSNH